MTLCLVAAMEHFADAWLLCTSGTYGKALGIAVLLADTVVQDAKYIHDQSSSCFGPRESLSFQPVVEFVDPVIAAGTLLSHAEAMAAGAENVCFWFVTRRF
jgi:hypothetical protein